jgi:hypothetical protein
MIIFGALVSYQQTLFDCGPQFLSVMLNTEVNNDDYFILVSYSILYLV